MRKEMGGRPLEEALGRGHGKDEPLLVEGLQGGQRGQASESGEAEGKVSVGAEVARHILIIRAVLKQDIFFVRRDLFLFFSMSCIQPCFICRPSDSTVSEDAVIVPTP